MPVMTLILFLPFQLCTFLALFLPFLSFFFVLFFTATDLSKDLTDKLRTDGSSRKASKGGLLKEKSRRKEKHSRKVQFERSGAQVRYEEERPGSQKANTKGAQEQRTERLRN